MRRFKGPNDVEEARKAVHKVSCFVLSESCNSSLVNKAQSIVVKIGFNLIQFLVYKINVDRIYNLCRNGYQLSNFNKRKYLTFEQQKKEPCLT